jgi:uncharacterized protein
MNPPEDHESLSVVPLFPLPNVVLFPRAVLPLHIFEERYKTMTADALAGSSQVAMALLKAGWEKHYYQKPAIDPVVCVGEILSWERLPDGKYNFLLQGKFRARIIHELDGLPYRRGRFEQLQEIPALELHSEHQRAQMLKVFTSSNLRKLPIAAKFAELLIGLIPTGEVADLVAFTFFEDVALKQQLLNEVHVEQRIDRVVRELIRLARGFNPAMYQLPVEPGLN